jgi:hypothetical protein
LIWKNASGKGISYFIDLRAETAREEARQLAQLKNKPKTMEVQAVTRYSE